MSHKEIPPKTFLTLILLTDLFPKIKATFLNTPMGQDSSSGNQVLARQGPPSESTLKSTTLTIGFKMFLRLFKTYLIELWSYVKYNN